jgi:hypothetical protein
MSENMYDKELEQEKESIKQEIREKMAANYQHDPAGNKTHAVLTNDDYELLLELCARGGVASGLLEAFMRMQEEAMEQQSVESTILKP